MWQNDKYSYTPSILEKIARHYESIYDGIPILCFGDKSYSYEIKVLEYYQIAEYKADFDIALDTLGKGKWPVDIDRHDFGDFRRGYGRRQQTVIANIYGEPDRTLEQWGLYDISHLKNLAYNRMAAYLNGVSLDNRKPER